MNVASKWVFFQGFDELKKKFRAVRRTKELVDRTAAIIYVDSSEAPYAEHVHEDRPLDKSPHKYKPPGARSHFMLAVMENEYERQRCIATGYNAFRETRQLQVDVLLEETAKAYLWVTKMVYTPKDTGALRESLKVAFMEYDEPILPGEGDG